MQVGCYSLDLYCTARGANDRNHGEVSTCGWEKNVQQFTGRTRAECYREAKAEGWRVTRNKELCPKHYQELREKKK